MSTRGLPVALGSELVTLITSSADAPPNWSRSTCAISPAIVGPWAIRVLSMFAIMVSVDLSILVDINVLL